MPTDSEKLNLQIENFRSIRETVLSLQPGVNLLIGPNGSGKTCLLAALKFLRDVFVDGAGLAMAKSGGPLRNYHRGQAQIRFSVDLPYGIRVYNRKRKEFRFSWNITIAQSGPEQIATVVEENLQIYLPLRERTNILSFNVDRKKAAQSIVTFRLGSKTAIGRDVFLGPYESGPKESKEKIFAQFEDLLTKVAAELKASGDNSLLPYLARTNAPLSRFVGRFVNLNEYNIVPDLARQATDQLPFAEMAPTGAGLSEVIHALTNKYYHRLGSLRAYASNRFGQLRGPGLFNVPWQSRGPLPFSVASSRGGNYLQHILERINSELSTAVKSITGLSTDIDPTNGKRFTVFEAGKDRFYPEEVSDGTIKWLCILVSIFVPHSSIYLLEEPENFLHPWMQQQLIRLMREQTPPSVFYVLTTHSASVLNAARPEEITTVSRNDLGTHAERLEEREMIATVLEESNFGLGDLWVSGLLGAVPAGDE